MNLVVSLVFFIFQLCIPFGIIGIIALCYIFLEKISNWWDETKYVYESTKEYRELVVYLKRVAHKEYRAQKRSHS